MSEQLNALHRKGHEVAQWHRKKQNGVPSRRAWGDDMKQATLWLRKKGWSDLSISIVIRYAEAALHYDRGEPEGRGLWASEEIGNLEFDDFDVPGRLNEREEKAEA